MKVSELRIGDWYNSVKFNVPVRCELVDLYELCVKSDGAYNDPPIEEMFEPISLTEEWLLKFGFDQDKITKIIIIYETEFWDIKWVDGMIFMFNYNYMPLSDSLKHIQYVHQLQNLYFALTEKELTIKK